MVHRCTWCCAACTIHRTCATPAEPRQAQPVWMSGARPSQQIQHTRLARCPCCRCVDDRRARKRRSRQRRLRLRRFAPIRPERRNDTESLNMHYCTVGGSSDGAGGGSSEAGRQQLARADRRPVGAREATESGTALRGVSQDRVARGLTITSTSVDPPLSLPQSPSLSLLDAGRSRADFLSGVRVALIGRDRPLLLTYLFAEGT